MSDQLSRKEFANQAEEYIRKLNEIAENNGLSVITAFYIEGSSSEPSDCIIDWRNMSLDENLYAMGRFTQDIMNSYDEDGLISLDGAPFSEFWPITGDSESPVKRFPGGPRDARGE